jgi:bacillopeptidase F (M6 metalloprotease family)
MGNPSGLSNVATATTLPAATIFSDDMESGPNGWTATGLWHQSSFRSDSPSRAWYYGDEATRTYDNGAANAGTLTSPVIDLRNATHPVLIYREWRSVEDTPIGDAALLQIGTGPNQWTTVTDSNFSTAIDPLNGQYLAAAYLGWNTPIDTDFDTPQWVSRAIDLSAYVGKKIHIRFAFETANPDFNSYEGWYVDDVSVFDNAGAGVTSAAIAAADLSLLADLPGAGKKRDRFPWWL